MVFIFYYHNNELVILSNPGRPGFKGEKGVKGEVGIKGPSGDKGTCILNLTLDNGLINKLREKYPNLEAFL